VGLVALSDSVIVPVLAPTPSPFGGAALFGSKLIVNVQVFPALTLTPVQLSELMTQSLRSMVGGNTPLIGGG
jgi:hypothetical protein